MLKDWNLLPEDVQLALSHEALLRAADTIAGQAEILAGEMDCGGITDRGGADALRLLAAVVRVTGRDSFAAGHG